MDTVESGDGTRIAFEKLGDGPPLIVVGGAFSDRASARPAAEELAKRFTVFSYDRRGRGDSGDEEPYAVGREIEDIEAIIAEAGGSALVYGHSSGAALALRATAHGLPISRLALYEPPFMPEDEEMRRGAREDAETINALLAEGRRSDAVAHFLGGVGMPPKMVEEWSHDERIVATAHTLSYDFEILGNTINGAAIPRDVAGRVYVPTLVLAGGASPGWVIEVAKQVADAIPDGRFKILEGQEHGVSYEILTPILADFFAG